MMLNFIAQRKHEMPFLLYTNRICPTAGKRYGHPIGARIFFTKSHNAVSHNLTSLPDALAGAAASRKSQTYDRN